MASRSIATKVSIDGEKEYKSAITSINTSLRTLKAEMTAVTAQFQTNANSEEALRAKIDVLNQTLDKQREKINTLKSAVESGKAAQDKYRASIQEIKKNLDTTNQGLSKFDEATKESGKTWLSYKTQLDAANQKLKALKKSTDDTSAEQAELNGTVSDLESKMKDLETSTGGAAKTAGELLETQAQTQRTLATQEERLQGVTNKTEKWQAQLYTAKASEADLKVEIDKTNGYLNEAVNSADHCATSIDKMGKEVKDAAQDMDDGAESASNVGESFDTLSSILVTSGIVNGIKKVASALKECVDVSADFHYTMATVQAVSGATTDEMGKLEAQAKNYASTTVFMAQDVANAYQVMGQAGWTVDEMLDSMAGTMSLASASGEDLGGTTNMVVDAMTAFGYGADQAGHFADVLARASADTNTSVALLGNSFQACATTAGGMGYSIDDVAVALGIMANNGLKAEMSGTALTTALTRMSGANETANGAMEDLGLTMFNASGQAKPLGQFLGELRDSFAGMTEEQKINNAYMLAGQRGMKGLLAIVNASDDDWDNLTESIANCSGAAEEMADTKLDTYTGDVKLLKSAMEGLEIEVGDQLTPALSGLAEAVAKGLKSFTGFIKEHESAVPIITGVVGALTTFTASVTVATTAVKVFQLVHSTLGAALGPVAIVLGVVSAAIGVLGTAMIQSASEAETMANAADTARESAEKWDETKQKLESTEAETTALMESLLSLVGQQEKSAATNAQIKSTVDELNSSVEGLNLSYDEQTGTLNMTEDALKSYIHTMMLQKEAESIVKRMVELDKEHYNVKEDLESAAKTLADAQSDVNEEVEKGEQVSAENLVKQQQAQEAYDELSGSLRANKSEYDSLSERYKEINEEISENTTLTGEATDGNEGLGEAAEETGEAVEAMTKEMQDANDKLADLTAASIDARENGGDLRETYNELEKEFEKYKDEASESAVKTAELELATLNLRATNEELITQYPGLVAGVESLGIPLEDLSQWLINNEISAEEWGEGVNSVKDSIINGFQKLSTDAEISLSDMAENLEYNVQAYQNWDQNLTDLMADAVANNDQGAIDLINVMRNLGVGYAAQVQAMVDDTSGNYEKLAAAMGEVGETGGWAFYNSTNESLARVDGLYGEYSASGAETLQTGDYEGAGAANAEDYAGGIEDQTGTVETAAEAVSDAGAGAAEGEKSKYRDAGGSAITQFKIGMLGKQESVKVAAQTIAASAASQFNSVSWYNVGYSIAAGVARGINANSWMIRQAAENAAQDAYKAAKDRLGIRSPSRVMAEVGRYYDEGFAKGITKHISEVTKAANRMSRESAAGVYGAGNRAETEKKSKESGNGSQKLEKILEQYLPEIVEKMDNGSGITAKGLAKAVAPYIDSDLGNKERRKRRGN